ncbi:rapunzel 2 [Diretmus argenteus]
MADNNQVNEAVRVFLNGVDIVSSFASTINPLFNIITAVVRLAGQGLAAAEPQLDQHFEAICTKVNSISQTNQQILNQMAVDEVNETCGRYEERINHQYSALTDMVNRVKINPGDSQQYVEEFNAVFEGNKGDLSLLVFYNGVVVNKDSLFARPLLEVYFESCGRKRAVMEARCSHLIHLFYKGLMALWAHAVFTQDDTEELENKWVARIQEMEDKMMDVLGRCETP